MRDWRSPVAGLAADTVNVNASAVGEPQNFDSAGGIDIVQDLGIDLGYGGS